MHKQWRLFLSEGSEISNEPPDLLKEIELDDIVDNMKTFQELESAENDKWNCLDLQVSAGKSYNHHSRKRSFSAARNLKTWLRSTMTKERF